MTRCQSHMTDKVSVDLCLSVSNGRSPGGILLQLHSCTDFLSKEISVLIPIPIPALHLCRENWHPSYVFKLWKSLEVHFEEDIGREAFGNGGAESEQLRRSRVF